MGQSDWKRSLPHPGLHVAIIMDGSGRWAERRGWPRAAGHRAGAQAVRRVVRAACPAGISTLTLFAFSAANWRRPPREVAGLMDIFADYLETELAVFLLESVRVNVIGRRDRLPAALHATIQKVERATAAGARLHLRLAIDYSAREALAQAAARFTRRGRRSGDDFARALAKVNYEDAPAPDVDLLVRTGGERRLSDCLLWEGAFAEMVFTDRLWPDFDAADLEAALAEFYRRERRFGGVVETAAS
jgi:undecaprenyl diphosphate synthase